MNPCMVLETVARRRRARALAPRLALAGVLASLLAWPAQVPAQQQLPSRPIANVPEKKSGLNGVLDQITPRLPKGYDAQRTPLDTPWMDIAPATPQPVPCHAFKGSAEDMNALRKTAREAAARRTITPQDFEGLVPKACAGQEWAFYLLFLSNVGQGKL